MDEVERLKQRIGTTLGGKWTLERLLGYGGMAAVYVGVHKIGRRAAIKILHPEVAANREIARRFEQEAHAVNKFSHPGAVEILDIDVTQDGAPFLVMELLDGDWLADLVDAGKVDAAQMLRLTDELLDVLTAAHGNRIIHRDIKPDNLFVLRDGRLKVLDFGIAQMRQGAPRTIHTAAGVTIGTLTYMSPEQVAGKEIDGRADLFAVGCTMFRIVSGRSPHEGETDLELMVKMATEPAPPLAQVAPGVPADLCAVVDRALAFEMERRYPDALTMQGDVRALLGQRSPPYASARLAAGDLPNARGTAIAAGAAAAAAGAAAPASTGAPNHTFAPASSRNMPQVTRAADYPLALAPTMYGATPTPSSAAPVVTVARTPEARAKDKERLVLFIMGGAICLALVIGLVQWLIHGSHGGNAAVMSEDRASSTAGSNEGIPPDDSAARPADSPPRSGKGNGPHGKKWKKKPKDEEDD